MHAFIHIEVTLCIKSYKVLATNMILCLKNRFLRNQYSIPHLRGVFRPFYIILSILGLFPYSVRLQSTKNGFLIIPKSIYLNLLCAASNTILVGSFLVLHIRQIYSSKEDNSLTEGAMTRLNYVAEVFALLMFCLVTYISVYLNRFKYVKILNMLSALIDVPTINSARMLGRLRIQIIIVMGTLTFLFIMQIAVNFSRNDSVYKMFLVVCSFILPQTVQFTTIAFFYLLIVMVTEILRNVREHLAIPLEKKADGFTKVGSRDGKLTLRQIERIYVDVFEIKQSVNQMFEAPILVTMMQCFHAIVSESHIIYHGLMVQHTHLGPHQIVNCSIWIAYQLIKIYTITSAGNLFMLEILKLSRAIHSLPTEKQDLRFFLEVQHLSVLISLPGKELTVYGYFPLDASLMFKVIASAGMYVIILVQFDKKT